MNKLIIENRELEIKEYKGERVVTAWDIAEVHGRDVREVNQQFKRNKDRLIEGEDYFVLSREIFSESLGVIQDFIPNNVKKISLFTESGYLMLVKTFDDELSWKIQKQLIKSYFKLLENIPQPLLEKVAKHDVEIEGIKHFVNEEWRINYGTQVSINKLIKDRVYLRSEMTGADKKKLFKSIYLDIQKRFGIKSYRDIKMLDHENVSNYVSAWIEPAYLKGDTKYAQSKLW